MFAPLYEPGCNVKKYRVHLLIQGAAKYVMPFIYANNLISTLPPTQAQSLGHQSLGHQSLGHQSLDHQCRQSSRYNRGQPLESISLQNMCSIVYCVLKLYSATTLLRVGVNPRPVAADSRSLKIFL
jgi:hypothetical protein